MGALTRFRWFWAAARRVGAGYRQKHGRWPALLRPRRYSEKMQWRKLFDLDPRYVTLCDKLAVRDFITARLGPAAPLPPLLWHGDDPACLPFDTLQPPFVLKSSHACGQTIIAAAGAAFDQAAARARAALWLAHRHGVAEDEPGYRPVPARLLVERQLFGADGGPPLERRFFVFDGAVALINTVFVEAGQVRNGAFHDPDWVRLPWHLSRDLAALPFPPPARLAPMLAAAARLGAGFEHVRVDIYDGGDSFWIGEITVYSWSGHAVFHPDAADFALGAFWTLRRQPWRMAAAILAGGEITPPPAG